MEFDVFISYANQDKVTADAACAQLEADGIRCWIAPRDVPPGAEWAGAIVDAIDQCRAMVLIFSSNANGSKQIRREVQRAFDREVPVLPFRIENIVPEKSLAYYMGPVHWLDALTTPLEHHLQKLAASVQALVRVTSPAGDTQSARILRETEARQRAQDEQHRTNEADELRRQTAEKSSAGEESYERRRRAEAGAIRQGRQKTWWPPLAVAAGLGLPMLGIVGAVIYQRLPQAEPVTPPLAVISASASMVGTWRGQGHQVPAGSSGDWSIVMTIESAGGSIEYPSLGCGGTLTQISNNGSLGQYREHITHVSAVNCIDGGLITVNSVDGELSWTWTVSYQSRQINAVAELSR